MRLVKKDNDYAVYAITTQEVRWLTVLMDAARDMDPYIRMVSDHETQALYSKFQRLQTDELSTEQHVGFSFEEFRDVRSIVLGTNTLDAEHYFPTLIDQFPSEKELDALDRHIDELFNKVYPATEVERIAQERRKRSTRRRGDPIN